MGRHELLPRHQGGRNEVQLGTRQVADDGLSGDLLPPGLGLPVPHDEVAVAHLAAGAEVQHPSAHPPVEDDSRVAEGAVGDCDGHAAHLVVDYLVPYEDGQGVGPGVPVYLQAQDGLVLSHVLGSASHFHVLRVVDRGDLVAQRAAGNDLAVEHRVLGEVRLPPEGEVLGRRLVQRIAGAGGGRRGRRGLWRRGGLRRRRGRGRRIVRGPEAVRTQAGLSLRAGLRRRRGLSEGLIGGSHGGRRRRRRRGLTEGPIGESHGGLRSLSGGPVGRRRDPLGAGQRQHRDQDGTEWKKLPVPHTPPPNTYPHCIRNLDAGGAGLGSGRVSFAETALAELKVTPKWPQVIGKIPLLSWCAIERS